MSNEVTGNTLTADNVVVVNNTITVGFDQSTGWIVADNFKLYYLGEDLSIYVDAYNDAVSAANGIDQDSPMLASAKSALQSAISTYGTGVDTSDKEALLEAAGALTSATNSASTSIAAYVVAKTAIDKANAIKDAHNFASASATTTFADAISAISTAYDAGTLTNADASAAGTTLGTIVTGWHANPNGAAVNYMENGFGLNDFDTNLYINTWSTEGDNDGTSFSVPFYEYWTGDGNSLGEKTWTGTLSDLPNGQYKISAWVRVRAKNETAATDATGITMDVNGGGEGENVAVDVTEGAQIGTSQFQIGTYEALGLVKNGMLYLNFNIADGNNISWLGIKNIKYTKVRDLTAEESFVAPTDIALDKTSVSLQTGEVVTLTATVTPDNADDKTVSWTSSDETVATVDANGVVTTVNAGTATITATADYGDNVTATCTVTVTDAPAPAFYSEIVNGNDYYIMNAGTGKFLGGANDWGTHASLIEHGIPFTAAKISDGVYTLASPIWNSSTDHFMTGTYVDNKATNLYIASLSDGKYSISTADGSAFVTARANSTSVTNEAGNANSSLAQWYFVSKSDRDKMLAAATTENPVDATYYVKQANPGRNLSAGAYGANAWSDYSLEGDNSNKVGQLYQKAGDVAQTITNIPNGTYTVTVQAFTSGSATFYANDQEVAVLANSENIASASVAANRFVAKAFTNTLTVTVTDRTLKIGLKSDDTDKWLVWDDVNLYMTSYTANTGITAEIDNAEIEVGATAQITAATNPANASFNALTYTSSDEAVATVDENGLVTAVAIGEATITVAASEMETFSKAIDVTVKASLPTALALSETEIALDREATSATLTITPTPDGANTSVTWESSDENVATVADGVVTAVAPGTATITATSVVAPAVSASATVTVTFPETEIPASTYTNDGATRTVATLSDNLIKNGAFEYPNAYYGWTVGNDAAMSDAGFEVLTEDGNTYVKSKKGEGGANPTAIKMGWAIESGKSYTFSYKIKGNAGTSSWTATSLTNAIGTETFMIERVIEVTADWQEHKYTFTNTDGYTYLQFFARWYDAAYDDFYLCEATTTTEGNVQYALDAIPTANIGTGVFQYSQDAINDANALEQGTATVDEVEAAYDALTTLNAPEDGKLYNVINISNNYDYKDKALTFKSASDADLTTNSTGMSWGEDPGSYYPQAVKFTAVDGTKNGYKMSYTRADGEVIYVATEKGAGYGNQTQRIRPTNDASKALTVVISSTADNSWKLYNTENGNYIGATSDNGVYTNSGNNSDVQIQEAVNNEVALNITAANQYGTLILPFDATVPEDVEAYSVSEATAKDELVLVEAKGDFKANTPYIVFAENGATATLEGLGSAYTDATYTDGWLTGVYATTAAPNGSYILQNQETTGVGFYQVDTAKYQPNVPANRAYLTVPNAGVKAFYLGDTETAIKSVFDGIANGDIYDLNGRKVQKLQKGGIYIVNGKKVSVK